MKKSGLLCLIFIILAFASGELSKVYSAGIPIPYRVGGYVTIDGEMITDTLDDGLLVAITKLDGSDYQNAAGQKARDSDGLNDNDFYLIDVPIFSATDQPGGANPGESAKIHIFKDGKQMDVISPAQGLITIGLSGEIVQVSIVAKTIATENIGHAIGALKVCAGLPASGPTLPADASCDGRIGIEEAIKALQVIAGIR